MKKRLLLAQDMKHQSRTQLTCHRLLTPYGDENESPKRTWQVEFIFLSDLEPFQSGWSYRSLVDWSAHPIIKIWDLTGLMMHGLFLTPFIIREAEGHLKHTYHPEAERWTYTRSYTLVDPRWSSRLLVESWDIRPVASFRLDHLSADKVLKAKVEDDEESTVYCYDLEEPELSGNFIYDDMPMSGLWPWPKEGRIIKDQ